MFLFKRVIRVTGGTASGDRNKAKAQSGGCHHEGKTGFRHGAEIEGFAALGGPLHALH
jgi:hypothetical protein